MISWRLRLAAVTRNMDHDELYMWLEKIKLRRTDADVIRTDVVMGPLLPAQLGKDSMGDWEVYRVLRKLPLETLVFALARTDPGPPQERLREYLTDIRHRTLSVSGDDVLALGLKKGPAVGRTLEKLKEMRVDRIVQGREAELAAARRLLKDTP